MHLHEEQDASTHNRSTGPRTPEGKAISSQNRLKHGLASGRILLQDEDPAEFEALVEALVEDHQPANTAETLLVHDLAKFRWLTDRAIRLQQECFAGTSIIDITTLPLMIRYQNTNHRAFLSTLKALQTLQKERRKLEQEFVSSNYDPTRDGLLITDENGIPWDSPDCQRSGPSPRSPQFPPLPRDIGPDDVHPS